MSVQQMSRPRPVSSSSVHPDLDLFWSSSYDGFLVHDHADGSSISATDSPGPDAAESGLGGHTLGLDLGMPAHHQLQMDGNHPHSHTLLALHTSFQTFPHPHDPRQSPHTLAQAAVGGVSLHGLALSQFQPQAQTQAQAQAQTQAGPFAFSPSQMPLPHHGAPSSVSDGTSAVLSGTSTGSGSSHISSDAIKALWPRKVEFSSFGDFGPQESVVGIGNDRNTTALSGNPPALGSAETGPDNPSVLSTNSAPSAPFFRQQECSLAYAPPSHPAEFLSPSSHSPSRTASTATAPLPISQTSIPAIHSVPELVHPSSSCSSSTESTPAHSRKNSYKDDQEDSGSGLHAQDAKPTEPGLAVSHSIKQLQPHSFPLNRKSALDRTLIKAPSLSMKEKRRRSSAKIPSRLHLHGHDGAIKAEPPSSALDSDPMELDPDDDSAASRYGHLGPALISEQDFPSKERTPHTEVERKYRHGINYGIALLGNSVPKLRQQIEAYNAEQEELRLQASSRERAPAGSSGVTGAGSGPDPSVHAPSPGQAAAAAANPADAGSPEAGEGNPAGPSASAGGKTTAVKCKYKYPSKLAIIQGATDYIRRLEAEHEKLRRDHAALQGMVMNGLVVLPGQPRPQFPASVPQSVENLHGIHPSWTG